MHWEAEGAYTGMISPVMLYDIGCRWVLIGHSERRKYFNETDEIVNRKLFSALSHNLKPVVCVGENIEERESGMAESIVKNQILSGLGFTNPEFATLQEISEEQMTNTTIAYEPVWAIGTGKTATPADAEKMHSFIRSLISEKFSENTADKVRILYGGSAKPENIDSLMAKKDIDGVLVGGASLDADSFTRIINFCS